MHPTVEVSLRPAQQIIEIPENREGARHYWRAYGSDPIFNGTWDGGPIEGGWYVVSVDWAVHKGRVHSPALYPDYGRGYFREADREHLPVSLAANESLREDLLVRFAAPVTALRFDPSVAPMEFSAPPMRLRKVGRKEALKRLVRGSLAHAGSPVEKAGLFGRIFLSLITRGLRGMADRLYASYSTRVASVSFSDYEVWQEFYDSMDEDRLAAARQGVARLDVRPLVSIIVPTYNTPEPWLRRCIESVQAQIYPDWELCIADDASTLPHVRTIIEEYAAADARIKFVARQQNGHISKASNSALELATGAYVALLDHDDELHPFALLECVQAFDRNPGWKMLFTDEDKIDTVGKRSDPYFKSDWNPDLFLSQNCICHLTIYETALVRQVDGFRVGYEGAQDWDLTLRITELLRPNQIGHVPKVLYHWRMIEGSTAMAPGEKSYAHLAAMRSIEEHLLRAGQGAQVKEMSGYSGYFRIEYPLPTPAPLVSLLIPTRDRVDLLKQCIDSVIERTDYPNFEIVVIDNDSREKKSKEYFEKVQHDPRIRVVPYPYPFNYSAINNFGARAARGEVFALLNNDIEVLSRNWLDEMVGHALRPDIGVVGAMLYYPDDRIQHAGVILGIGGVAGHAYVGMARGWPGDKHRGGLAQSLSAVTAACAVVRKSVFVEVGGLDEGLEVAFNDIDFCLRVREKGYRNLWTPFAELYHHESASRGYETTPEKIERFKREESFMKLRWGKALSEDPYYNPNLALDATPFTLAYPPRGALAGMQIEPVAPISQY